MTWLYALTVSIFAHAMFIYAMPKSSLIGFKPDFSNKISVAVQVVNRPPERGRTNILATDKIPKIETASTIDSLANGSGSEVVSNVDGEITEPTYVDVASITGVKPRYPYRSIRYGEEGRVVINVFHENGVIRFRLYRTSGYERLDQAALYSLKNFDLSTIEVPEKSGLLLAFNFELTAQ